MTTPATPSDPAFVDRRSNGAAAPQNGVERRQFANSYDDLSPNGRELARALDEYKLKHRRRFVNYDEMLEVIQALGYRKV